MKHLRLLERCATDLVDQGPTEQLVDEDAVEKLLRKSLDGRGLFSHMTTDGSIADCIYTKLIRQFICVQKKRVLDDDIVAIVMQGHFRGGPELRILLY